MQWHKLSIPPIWVQRGDLPHSGDVCRTPSADLEKSHQGFEIMHPYQYGIKRGSMVCGVQPGWSGGHPHHYGDQ